MERLFTSSGWDFLSRQPSRNLITDWHKGSPHPCPHSRLGTGRVGTAVSSVRLFWAWAASGLQVAIYCPQPSFVHSPCPGPASPMPSLTQSPHFVVQLGLKWVLAPWHAWGKAPVLAGRAGQGPGRVGQGRVQAEHGAGSPSTPCPALPQQQQQPIN